MTWLLARAAPWRALLGLALAAAILGGVGLALGGGPGLRVLQLGLLLVGAAAACALDEPAAAVVDACPVPRVRHVIVRAVSASPALLLGGGLVASWWSLEGVNRLVLLQNAGCWLLGFTLSTLARTRIDEPAEVVVAGYGLVLVTVMLVEPIGRRLALFPMGEDSTRATRTWCVVLLASVVALVLAVRERRWR
ncbi:MAG TPA: hypothetical protein VM097_12150 [Mycobacteriales bacterium]|nr:hypothetical protein [Mycobacteriales bacterium]